MNKSGLEARVLVCDSQSLIVPDLVGILSKRFGGELQTRINPPVPTNGVSQFQVGGVEFTVVGDMEKVVELVTGKPSPYYALVVYETGQLKQTEGSAGRISWVNKHDSFLPQMIVGEGLTAGLASHCARGGALYFAETHEELLEQLDNIFRTPSRIPHLTVVKIGGSAFDFDRQYKDSLNLEYVCQLLIQIHQDRAKLTRRPRDVNRMIVIAGGGQHGNVVKDATSKYYHNLHVRISYPKSMADATRSNLEYLRAFFGDSAALLTTGAFYYINTGSTSKRIPLIGTAPHYIMARDGIPLEDSDTHTIVLAESYFAERVVLIKRTDAIYDFDPYRGFVFTTAKDKLVNYPAWIADQLGKNRRHSVVTVDQLLNGTILREGTGDDGEADGSTGHLMEDSALRYFKGCKNVKEILVVPIAPEEMYFPLEDRYVHVVTGHEIFVDPKTGWKGILEQNIRDAFRGIALSKIVRGN